MQALYWRLLKETERLSIWTHLLESELHDWQSKAAEYDASCEGARARVLQLMVRNCRAFVERAQGVSQGHTSASDCLAMAALNAMVCFK